MSIANLGVVGLSGENCAFQSGPTHVIVDVHGYMTGIAWADVPDVRVLDTRIANPQLVAPFG